LGGEGNFFFAFFALTSSLELDVSSKQQNLVIHLSQNLTKKVYCTIFTAVILVLVIRDEELDDEIKEALGVERGLHDGHFLLNKI